MDFSRSPSTHLVHGLRRLLQDVHVAGPLPGHGLSGVCCGDTELISFDQDSLQYCGQPVTELFSAGSFERVIWLLLNSSLPNDEQLADIQSVMNDAAVIDSATEEILERIPIGTRPLEVLPFSISLLSFFDPTPADQCTESTRSRVWRMLAQLPLMLKAALGAPLRRGRAHETVSAGSSSATSDELTSLSWAGRLLYCVRNDGRLPTPAEDAAINAILICQCLTEMRPACFASRLSGSTVNDVSAALQSASTLFVSQLRNDPFAWAGDLLRSLQGPESAEAWWRRREGQPMPFGFSGDIHDPRPKLLRDTCRSLLGSHRRIVVEASACRLEKILATRQLYPTSDWVTARCLTLLNIESDRHSLIVAMARLAGWAAQAMEQHHSGVSLLPSLRYSSQDECQETA